MAEWVERGVLVERDDVWGVCIAEDVTASAAVMTASEVREGSCAGRLVAEGCFGIGLGVVSGVTRCCWEASSRNRIPSNDPSTAHPSPGPDPSHSIPSRGSFPAPIFHCRPCRSSTSLGSRSCHGCWTGESTECS